jgi:hypothetical protein
MMNPHGPSERRYRASSHNSVPQIIGPHALNCYFDASGVIEATDRERARR